MKKEVRLIAWMLVIATLAISFVSCGNVENTDDSTVPTTTAAVSGEDTVAETTQKLDDYGRPWLDADIPEKNYGGTEFKVHTRGNVEQYEWKADVQDGTILNDAIYKRNSAVEELLGVKIVTIAEGSWSNYDSELLPKIKSSISSSDGAYDLLAGYGAVTSLATAGLLCELGSLNYIDFEKPWWSTSFNENANIYGKNYFAVGSLSLSMIYSMMCIFVNTDILTASAGNSYNIYQTVKDKKWTLEEVGTLSKQAWVDSNSNGIADLGDTVGLSFPDMTNAAVGFVYSCGIKLTSYDDNKVPTFKNADVEKISSTIDAINKLFWETEGVASKDTNKIVFTDGQTLFNFRWLYWGQTEYAGQMDHYGIVPMPMLSTEQENYITTVQAGMHTYCIPVDVKDKEAAAIITEALAAESYRSLVPAYYEVVLKTRYSKDAETSQMLDIMYETVNFEFAYIWKNNITYSSSVTAMAQKNANAFATQYKGLSKAAESQLNKLTDAINKLS